MFDSAVRMDRACVLKEVVRGACIFTLGSGSLSTKVSETLSAAVIDQSVCEYWRGLVCLLDTDIFALAGSCAHYRLTDFQAEGAAVIENVSHAPRKWASYDCRRSDVHLYDTTGAIPISSEAPPSVSMVFDDNETDVAHVYRALRQLFANTKRGAIVSACHTQDHFAMMSYQSTMSYKHTGLASDMMSALDASVTVMLSDAVESDTAKSEVVTSSRWQDIYESVTHEHLYQSAQHMVYEDRFCARERMHAECEVANFVSPAERQIERDFMDTFDVQTFCSDLLEISPLVRNDCVMMSRHMRITDDKMGYDLSDDANTISTACSGFAVHRNASKYSSMMLSHLIRIPKEKMTWRSRCTIIDEMGKWTEGKRDLESGHDILRRVSIRTCSVLSALIRRYRSILRLPSLMILIKMGKVISGLCDAGTKLEHWELMFIRLMARRCQDTWAACDEAIKLNNTIHDTLEVTCLRDAHLNVSIARMYDMRNVKIAMYPSCCAWLDELKAIRISIACFLRVSAFQLRDAMGLIDLAKSEAYHLLRTCSDMIMNAKNLKNMAIMTVVKDRCVELSKLGVDIAFHFVAAADRIEQRTSVVLGYEPWSSVCVSPTFSRECKFKLFKVVDYIYNYVSSVVDPYIDQEKGRVWKSHLLRSLHECRKLYPGIGNTSLAAKRECANGIRHIMSCQRDTPSWSLNELRVLAHAFDMMCQKAFGTYADANIHGNFVLNDDADGEFREYLHQADEGDSDEEYNDDGPSDIAKRRRLARFQSRVVSATKSAVSSASRGTANRRKKCNLSSKAQHHAHGDAQVCKPA